MFLRIHNSAKVKLHSGSLNHLQTVKCTVAYLKLISDELGDLFTIVIRITAEIMIIT